MTAGSPDEGRPALSEGGKDATTVPPAAALTGISSMATRGLLAELASAWLRDAGLRVEFEAGGGVEVVARLEAGEAFDLVVLASGALAGLLGKGRVIPGTERAFAVSHAALAVKSGSHRPPIGTRDSLFRTLGEASSIGYSTGPSGDALIALLDKAGILAEVRPRLLQAPPGVPVARLIGEGRVEIGLQQLSELAGREGIEVLGLLPEGATIDTTFSAAVSSTTRLRPAAQSFLDFLGSSAAQAAIRRAHMTPVAPGNRTNRSPL